MILITIALLVSTALGTPIEAENARLLQSNRALLNALRELQVGVDEVQVGKEEVREEEVGQSVKSTCLPMTGFQACTGPKHQLDDMWSRRGGGQIFMGYGEDTMPGEEYCRVKCENMGIPGCCEWQVDNYQCVFTAYTSSTVADSGSRKVWDDNWDYEEIPLRYGSVCSVSNCVYQMEHMVERWGDCDWGKQDKAWQKSMEGGGHSIEDCIDFCMNDPGCVFAASSSTGYCHIYKTCNHNPGGTGWTSGQKVCKGTLEYNNHPLCTHDHDPEVCIPPGVNN